MQSAGCYQFSWIKLFWIDSFAAAAAAAAAVGCFASTFNDVTEQETFTLRKDSFLYRATFNGAPRFMIMNNDTAMYKWMKRSR